jgi:hypothetical protein
MLSQLLVVASVVLIITSISFLLMNTKMGNAYVVCVNEFNHTNVIPCSDQNAIDKSTSNTPANITGDVPFRSWGNLTMPTSTYENRTYGIRVQYPSGWVVEQSNISSVPIDVARFFSTNGYPKPTAEISIYVDILHNSTVNLDNYAHYSLNGYKHFSAFALLRLNTNYVLAGTSAYELIGTFEDSSSGLQKLMEIGTIIGDQVYIIQYIVDAPRYSDYLQNVQKMIDLLQIKSPPISVAKSDAPSQMQPTYQVKEKKTRAI